MDKVKEDAFMNEAKNYQDSSFDLGEKLMQVMLESEVFKKGTPASAYASLMAIGVFTARILVSYWAAMDKSDISYEMYYSTILPTLYAGAKECAEPEMDALITDKDTN